MTSYDTALILSLISEHPMTVRELHEMIPRSCAASLCSVLRHMEERGEARIIDYRGRAPIWEACR